MWKKLNLRARIDLLLAALVVVALSGGSVMVWYTYRIQNLFAQIIDQNLACYASAAALETALVNQKGYVTYYYLDGDPTWLEKFEEQRKLFDEELRRAQHLAHKHDQVERMKQISDLYTQYIAQKTQVIEYYQTGRRAEGAELHKTVRGLFFEIMDLCEKYKMEHFEEIQQAQAKVGGEASRLRLAGIGSILVHMLIVIGLGVFVVHQILVPVATMLKDAGGDSELNPSGNIVTALSQSVSTLLKNVDQAQHELEKSRENLLQSEKMAMVGRLAASMAHSIRNPFTSVKMRLFSLSRSLKLDEAQQEDFQVISQEIRHIDTIVQNFLEFSRPPKLVMQAISPSAVVDNTLQLLSHRLDSYGVAVEVKRQQPLPEVLADPEQLKEVLVNLIINACEEMKSGGAIVITESVRTKAGRPQAVLHVADNGPGVPSANAEKIFQPFFTTKDEGTGLGLSIAHRIVTEHNGNLRLDPTHAKGAAFVICLPVKENKA
ncbi:MAG: ATP-binding protein [Desulfobacteraceae bacterium]|nr:ATP-binding protein [Desulfobacteraceae bacterium]